LSAEETALRESKRLKGMPVSNRDRPWSHMMGKISIADAAADGKQKPTEGSLGVTPKLYSPYNKSARSHKKRKSKRAQIIMPPSLPPPPSSTPLPPPPSTPPPSLPPLPPHGTHPPSPSSPPPPLPRCSIPLSSLLHQIKGPPRPLPSIRELGIDTMVPHSSSTATLPLPPIVTRGRTHHPSSRSSTSVRPTMGNLTQ